MADNVFTLVAKLLLDSSDYESKLKTAGELAHSVGSGIGAVLKGAGTVAVAALGGAATAVTTLTKQSVDAFSSYEQLVGGVETLFGTGSMTLVEYADSMGQTIRQASEAYQQLIDAPRKVEENANNAYKTAGMSANEYMETVTSFSASLLQSLGGDTAAAADYADMAIRDMSDNANKMGTNIASIQNAYQGFAKQNYTMLDNLKLGYGGTKGEMERLIADAEKLDSTFVAMRDENGDLALSYSDVVDAIHIVQQNMGITGTTAAEADKTVSGSLSSIKAAWENLVAGLGKEGTNFDELIENIILGAEKFLDNMLPVVDRVLGNIGTVVEKFAPIIAEKLPVIIEKIVPIFVDNLPAIMDGIMMLIDAIIQQLPTLIRVLIPALVTMTVQIIATLIEYLPEILEALWDAILAILDEFGILDWLINTWQSIKDWFSGAWNAVKEFFLSIPGWYQDNVNQPIIDFFKNLWETVAGFFEGLWNDIVAIWETVAGWFDNNVIQPVVGFFTGLYDSITGIFSSIWDAITNIFVGASDWFYYNVIQPIIDKFGWLLDLFPSVGGAAKVVADVYNARESAPHMARGGVLGRGQIGILEGDGAEAVVPLDQNERWIRAVAEDMQRELIPGGIDVQTELLEAIRDLKNMRVVMDTGATVGALATPMNGALGDQYSFRRRGMI